MWSRQRRIDAAADAWVIRLRRPHSDKELAAFDTWYARDPRHAAAFHAAHDFMGTTAGATRVPAHVPAIPDTERSPSTRRWFRPALAATTALAIAAVSVSTLWRPTTAPTPASIAGGSSEIRTQMLADGSRLTLDAGSAVSVDFSGNERRVTLVKGRARFEVAHNPARPFIVTAGDRTITARGTVFDVALNAKHTNVTLIEGRVDIDRVGHRELPQPVHLVAGQTLVANRGAVAIAATAPAATGWTEKRVPFDNAPLETVIARANRNGGPPIRLGDPALGKQRVIGVFDLTDTRSLAHKLATALDLADRNTPEAIFLERRK